MLPGGRANSLASSQAAGDTRPVTAPSADSFTALARSSPWLWTTLRFTESRRLNGENRALRAWLRRPDRLRVETLEGSLLQIVQQHPEQSGVLTSDGGYVRALPWPATVEHPVRRSDGLVLQRPDGLGYDAPMYQDYRWVAMLDPVELAEGRDPDDGTPGGPSLVIDSVAEVEHAGRPAWEAVVRTTSAYSPRCGCCPLLRSREVDLLEYADYPEHVLTAYPDAHRVRLDTGTGVCVRTEEIGGIAPGQGHDLRIEAVDEPIRDDRFRLPRRVPPRAREWWGARGSF
jgi:hypothetical protein